jgi:hypothetical protein
MDLKTERISKFIENNEKKDKNSLIMESILKEMNDKIKKIYSKNNKEKEFCQENKLENSNEILNNLGQRINSLPLIVSKDKFQYFDYKSKKIPYSNYTRYYDKVFDKIKFDDFKYTENTVNKMKSFKKTNKIIYNIENFNETKELKFAHKDFNRIVLPQTVKPPNLDLDLENVIRHNGIFPLNEFKKIYKNNELEYYENLPQPDDIEFKNLDTYMKPSEDPNLKKMMKKGNFKFSSSTSGISSTLSHFFYKLTNFKSPHFYNLSDGFKNEPLKFMMYQRKPSTFVLTKNENGNYSIDKNSMFDTKEEIILLKMGKYMEKLFTCKKEDFQKKYLKINGKIPLSIIDEGDYFNFVSYDKILLRSQIDCAGKDKDGNDIVFEIKTRASSPIRYDIFNWVDYLDYELNCLLGKHSSYEREFYDLIRGAFLKYLFQLKIGGMDGAFISYHNTRKIYGVEYITLKDIERRIFGNPNFSDIIFKSSLMMLQETMEYILKDFPNEKKLYMGIYANEWKGTLDLFVEPENEENYKDIDKYSTLENINDYYYIKKRPMSVHKYCLQAIPILNNVNSAFSILYENSDSYKVNYSIKYQGKPSKDEYMKFLHEGFKANLVNLENQYTGSWSLQHEKLRENLKNFN